MQYHSRINFEHISKRRNGLVSVTSKCKCSSVFFFCPTKQKTTLALIRVFPSFGRIECSAYRCRRRVQCELNNMFLCRLTPDSPNCSQARNSWVQMREPVRSRQEQVNELERDGKSEKDTYIIRIVDGATNHGPKSKQNIV